MAEVNIPDKAVARAQLAAKLTRPEFAAELHLILADYLERMASDIDTVSDPAGDAWLKAEAAGRREVVAEMRKRAKQLRGGAS